MVFLMSGCDCVLRVLAAYQPLLFHVSVFLFMIWRPGPRRPAKQPLLQQVRAGAIVWAADTCRALLCSERMTAGSTGFGARTHTGQGSGQEARQTPGTVHNVRRRQGVVGHVHGGGDCGDPGQRVPVIE